MPSGIEKYGITYGLSDTTKTRIQTGFDEIRAIPGWEDFRIPSYVWDYIDQTERDRLLTWLQTAYWTYRDNEDNWAEVSREEHFAWSYFWGLLAEWWSDATAEDRPFKTTNTTEQNKDALVALLENDCGIPEAVLSSLSANSGWGGMWTSGMVDSPFGVVDEWDYQAFGCAIEVFHDESTSDEFGYFWAKIITGLEYIYKRFDVYCEFYDDLDGYEYTYTEFEDMAPSPSELDSWMVDDGSDYGVAAVWPDEAYVVSPGETIAKIMAIVDGEELEIISGSATFKSFGLMDGQIEVKMPLDLGAEVIVAQDGYVFTGIVTEVTQNLSEGTYGHRIADPVTAGGGTVEYTSGNALDALQEAIENHGGTFETSMTTSETVIYTDEPQDAYQFFRAVSYAVGGVLQYGRDGVYRFVATPSAHGLNDSLVIADDAPTIKEHTKDYANYVQATIDERWMTEATTPTTESYSIGSQNYSATRLGEQIQSETISIGGDSLEITYNYDANGYMTKKEHSEEGSGIGAFKKTSLIEWSNISSDGNQYNVDELHEEFTYCQLYDNDTGTFYNSWVPTSKTTREWRVNLEGMAYLEEEIWGTEPLFAGSIYVSTDLYPVLGSLIRLHKYRGGTVVNPSAGPLEGRGIFKKYNYVHNGFEDAGGGIPRGTVGYVYVGTETRSVNPPALEKCAAEEENEIHIIAGAKDQGSIDVLGVHKYETQAVALNTSTGMQNFAKGVLYEKSFIRRANISTAMGAILPLDIVGWRNLVWTVKSVTVNLDSANDNIEIVTQSTINHLAGALSKEPVTWTDDVQNAINRRVGQFDNVSRGKVTTRVGRRRYTVQVEGKADPVEAKALNDDPVPVNASVLLVRPTGKNQPWILLNLSKEDEITIIADVEEDITPKEDPTVGITFFTADITDPMPGEIVTLTWDFVLPGGYSYSKVIIDNGIGNTIEITDSETKSTAVTYSEEDGVQFTPTAMLVTEFGESPVEYDPYELENGPILLTYYSISASLNPEEGAIPFDATFSLTVTPINEFEAEDVVECKVRPAAEDDYINIPLETGTMLFSYDTFGIHNLHFTATYENARGFPLTFDITLPITALWEGQNTVSLSESSSTPGIHQGGDTLLLPEGVAEKPVRFEAQFSGTVSVSIEEVEGRHATVTATAYIGLLRITVIVGAHGYGAYSVTTIRCQEDDDPYWVNIVPEQSWENPGVQNSHTFDFNIYINENGEIYIPGLVDDPVEMPLHFLGMERQGHGGCEGPSINYQFSLPWENQSGSANLTLQITKIIPIEE